MALFSAHIQDGGPNLFPEPHPPVLPQQFVKDPVAMRHRRVPIEAIEDDVHASLPGLVMQIPGHIGVDALVRAFEVPGQFLVVCQRAALIRRIEMGRHRLRIHPERGLDVGTLVARRDAVEHGGIRVQRIFSGLLHLACGRAGDGRRIQPAAEHRADRRETAQAAPHGLVEQLFEPLDIILVPLEAYFPFGVERPVHLRAGRPFPRYAHGVRRRNGLRVAEEGHLRRDLHGDEQKLGDLAFVRFIRNEAERPEGFDLRGERQHLAGPVDIVQWAEAEVIAGQEHPLRAGVPDGESEVTQQVGRRFGPPAAVRGQHEGFVRCLPVGVRQRQLSKQVLPVVDPPVEDEHDLSVVGDQRLRFRRGLRHRAEQELPHPHRPFGPDARAVRSPMGDGRRHAPEFIRRDRLAVQVPYACDAAHAFPCSGRPRPGISIYP